MRKTVLAAVGATMLLAACGGGSGDDAGSTAAAPAGSPAPEATGGRPVQLADGGTADLDAFAGQDVLLWFWAPW